LTSTINKLPSVGIVGAGFTGLTLAYELAKAGLKVTVFESESEIGGLAAAFDMHGEKLDRFYHHWFTNDVHVMKLIDELGLNDRVSINPTNTGVYYANHFFRLSTPWDLLNFTPLGFVDRIRLGLLALRARRVKHWMELENKTAAEWLKELGGENIYRIVWEPLLKGKFGPVAEDISAVWFWNKLKLRGGSRGKGGEERLAYFKGGFIALAEALATKIGALGGTILLNTPVMRIFSQSGKWQLETATGLQTVDIVIATTALPLTADLVRGWADDHHIQRLLRIQYLANVCLVLELDRPLSDTYWLNVNDPSFPFVGVIEHTNFERADVYGGRHIVYLSKYLPHTDAMYAMTAEQMLVFALPYLQKMFPALQRDWIKQCHLWKARWSQPVVEKNYSQLIPPAEGIADDFYVCSMAQIYPEDRGTNYAIREGRLLAEKIINKSIASRKP
jgi:protoporphyrinogen oxidase